MSRIAVRLGTMVCWLAAIALLAGGVAAVGNAHQTMLRSSAPAVASPILLSDGG